MISGAQSPCTVSELLFNSFEPLVVVICELLCWRAQRNRGAPLTRTEQHENKKGGLFGGFFKHADGIDPPTE